MVALPSKNQINKAGDYLADGLGLSGQERADWFDPDRHADATKIVSDYRAAHQRSLGNVSQGLRQIVRSETHEWPIVAQRLKRVPRIVRKLSRMGHGGLVRLEDIGGCRAILPNAALLEQVREHVERLWGSSITARRRSVHEPTEMGYRAYHLVMVKFDRKIEIQLRTQGQQDWADSIEVMDSYRQLTLKDGVGPESLMAYYSHASAMIYSAEYGQPRTEAEIAAYNSARDAVIEQGYFRRRDQ